MFTLTTLPTLQELRSARGRLVIIPIHVMT